MSNKQKLLTVEANLKSLDEEMKKLTQRREELVKSRQLLHWLNAHPIVGILSKMIGDDLSNILIEYDDHIFCAIHHHLFYGSIRCACCLKRGESMSWITHGDFKVLSKSVTHLYVLVIPTHEDDLSTIHSIRQYSTVSISNNIPISNELVEKYSIIRDGIQYISGKFVAEFTSGNYYITLDPLK